MKKKIVNAVKKLFGRSEMSALIPILIIMLVMAFVNPNFYKYNNLMDILRTTSFSFIAAVPLTMAMITGDRDMSVGATTALGGIVCAWGLLKYDLGIFPSVMLSVVAGLIIGVVKCYLLTNLKLPTYMVTLGLQYAINGFILITTAGVSIVGFSEQFQKFGQGKFLGIYYTVYLAIALGVVAHIVMTRTKFGREIYAVGGNIETARLAGINTKKIKNITNVLTSVFAVLTGVVYASRFNAAMASTGSGTEMTLMASIIIGGTANAGGTGTIFGTFCGCILLAAIKNALVVAHVSTYWQNLVFGTVLIISLIIDKIRTDSARGRLK